MEIEKSHIIFTSVMTELENLKHRKSELSRKLTGLDIPKQYLKYVYFEVAQDLLISDETVKNYHSKGKVADGYLGEAIYKLLVLKMRLKKKKPALNPS